MSILRGREIPMGIGLITAIIIVLDFYIKIPILQQAASAVGNWVVVGTACAMGLGLANLLRIHTTYITQRREGQWLYSIWLVAVMLVMAITGIIGGQQNTIFKWLFDYMYSPADGTAFTLATLYMTSAAYRTFRARSWEAATLLIFGVIAMLKNAPIGELIWPGFVPLGDFLITYPSGGVYRAIIMGIGLGFIVIGIRTLLGYESGYLGRT
jgi:hypothetical protein